MRSAGAGWVVAGLLVACEARAELPAPAPPGRVELRLGAGPLWLGGTPWVHNFTQEARFDAVGARWLTSLSADVATFSGWLGCAWFGVTYGFAAPWDITVIQKYDDGVPPQRWGPSGVHLLMLKGPGPRLRFSRGLFTVMAQLNVGVRTGFIVAGPRTLAPIELTLHAALAADVKVWRELAVGIGLELHHSLATGWPTGVLALQLRGWL